MRTKLPSAFKKSAFSPLNSSSDGSHVFVAQGATVLSSSQNKTLGVTEISSIPMGEIGNQKSLHQTAKLIKLVCLERYGKETFAAGTGETRLPSSCILRCAAYFRWLRNPHHWSKGCFLAIPSAWVSPLQGRTRTASRKIAPSACPPLDYEGWSSCWVQSPVEWIWYSTKRPTDSPHCTWPVRHRSAWLPRGKWAQLHLSGSATGPLHHSRAPDCHRFQSEVGVKMHRRILWLCHWSISPRQRGHKWPGWHPPAARTWALEQVLKNHWRSSFQLYGWNMDEI